MRNIITIAQTNLRIFFADTSNLVGLVVLPIILTLILGVVFGGSFGGGASTVRVDIIDLDMTDASAEFITRLEREALVFCMPESELDSCDLGDNPIDTDNPATRIESGNVSAVIVIPAGFGDNLANFEPIDIGFYSNDQPNQPGVASQVLSAEVGRINSVINAGQIGGLIGDNLGDGFDDEAERTEFTDAVYARAQTMWEQDPVAIQYATTTEGADASPAVGTGFGQSVPGIGTMYVMFTVFGGMLILIRDRRQWTLQRIGTMPVSRAEVIGGNILTYFTLGMIQYLVVFAVGLFVGLDFGNSPLAILVVMVSFTLCATALTFALGTRITSEAQANGLVTLLALIFAPLGGAWWPLEIVPDFMKVIGHVSPVAWAMDGFTEIIFFGGGLGDILIPIAVLLVASAILFVIGVTGFRYE